MTHGLVSGVILAWNIEISKLTIILSDQGLKMPPRKRKADDGAYSQRGKVTKENEESSPGLGNEAAESENTPKETATGGTMSARGESSRGGGRGSGRSGRGGARGGRKGSSKAADLPKPTESDVKETEATTDQTVNPLDNVDPAKYNFKAKQKFVIPAVSPKISDVSGSIELESPAGGVERVATIEGAVGDIAKTVYSIYRQLGLKYIRLLFHEPVFYARNTKEKLVELQKQTGVKIELARSSLPFSSMRVLCVTINEKSGIEDPEIPNTVKLLCIIFDYINRSGQVESNSAVQYIPCRILGHFGHPDKYLRMSINQNLAKKNPYIDPTVLSEDTAITQPEPTIPSNRIIASLSTEEGLLQARKQSERDSETVIPGQHISQQVMIPNEYVGAMIGKGGTKIWEMKQNSGSSIVIDELVKPGPRGEERMLTLTGPPECNMAAIMLIYKRVENERQFSARRAQ